MMLQARSREHGISLIEALVAMAVMAFGMLGVLGMQATLRTNSDIAKQRSEAVRIAQAAMETQRVFSSIDTAGAPVGSTAYQAIVSTAGAVAAAQDNANTTFFQTNTVVPYPSLANAYMQAPFKSVMIDVAWRDRTDAADSARLSQSVRVNSVITAVAPEILAALTAPAQGSAVQNPAGRNVAVPPGAVDMRDGTSQFSPPGAPDGVKWVFSNTTAVIQRICLNMVCSAFNGQLLSGYVRFATTAAPPTAASAENPPDASAQSGVGVSVTLSDPAAAGTATCYQSTMADPSYVAYLCAVPINTETAKWSGRANVTGLALAAGTSDATSSLFRVCRYTSTRSNASPPLVKNENHPFNYIDVQSALSNQNFLVIRAGGSGLPYACPDDTDVRGRTFDHQPTIS